MRRIQAAANREPVLTDAIGALLLAALGLLAVSVGIDGAGSTYDGPSRPVVVAVTLALTLPLALRRRFPFTVLVVVTLATWRIVDIPDLGVSIVVYWVALYSAGAYGRKDRRDVVRGGSVLASVAILADRLLPIDTAVPGNPALQATFDIAFQAFFAAAAWVFGNTMATRQEQQRALAERAAQLEREREAKAQRAVFEERVRIARELHDVVAHHVSVMGVQAGAARRVVDREPAKAAQALSSIEASSRQAVVELHRLLGFLRQADEPDRLASQPSLRRVNDLAREASGPDLDVVVAVEGELCPLPPTVDLSAFRVVQEALTNTRKHAHATRVDVTVRYRSDELEVEIVDDGWGRSNGSGTGLGGHGLIGMRERVGLHGGQLTVGPRAMGGFGVRATFPLVRT